MDTPAPLFERVAVIGLGLIGGSLALRARREGAVGHVTGCARSERTLAVARERGMVDAATLDPRDAVAGADLVVIAVPLGAYRALAAEIGPALTAGAVVTDVGSVKATVIADLAPHLPEGVAL